MSQDANFEKLFTHNRDWARDCCAKDPAYFKKLVTVQAPEFLWIGCSDSRVPANEIIGLPPGEVFVHRNVGNLISLTDFNCLAVVQYAVEILHVRHIIVCGHYGCGGVQAALGDVQIDLVSNWLSPLKELHEGYQAALAHMSGTPERCDKMCELNVIAQVRNLCRSSPVREAWQRGQPLAVHGLIYGLSDGLLHDLGVNVADSPAAETSVPLAIKRILAAHGRVVGKEEDRAIPKA